MRSLLLLLLGVSLASAQSTGTATLLGTLTDSSGAVVAGASIVVRSSSGQEQQTVTGPDGRFSLDAPEGALTIVVRAGGFAEKQ